MGKFSVPQAPQSFTTTYSNFKGVDFSSDEMGVSKDRFPYAQNLTFDKTGFPEKRPGYEELSQFEGKIHSFGEFMIDGEKKTVVHAGNRIYFLENGEAVPIKNAVLSTVALRSAHQHSTSNVSAELKINCNAGNLFINEVQLISLRRIKSGTENLSLALPDSLLNENFYEGEAHVTTNGCFRFTNQLIRRDSFKQAFSGYLKSVDGYKMTAGDEVVMSGEIPYKNGEQDLKCLTIVKYYGNSPSGRISLSVNSASENVLEFENTENDSVISEIEDSDSVLIPCKNAVLIVGKGIYKFITSYGVIDGKEIAYAPVTEIGRNCWENADTVSSEPGKSFENVNLLTRKRCETFILTKWVVSPDNSSNGLTNRSIISICLSQKAQKVEKVEYLASDGLFYEMSNYESFDISTTDRTKIVFTRCKSYMGPLYGAPLIAKANSGNTTENLRITYYAAVDENSSTYEESIKDCDTFATYGLGKDDRLFLTGNDNKKNYVWYSSYDDFTYFPDLNYLLLGNSTSKVMGFAKSGSNLLGFKEHRLDETSVFLISGSLANNGDALFTVTQGINGVGAISKNGISMIDDSPAYLGKNGIYQLTSLNVKSEKSVINISYFVNKRLIREEELEKASLVRYKDMLLLGVNGNVYVLYTDKKTYFETLEGEFCYEAMFWTDIPADKYFALEDALYFTKYDDEQKISRLYKFKAESDDVGSFNDTEKEKTTDESGNEIYVPKDKAINSYFMTVSDTDGSFMRLKTMVKRGCGIMIKPYTQSSAKIFVLTETNHEKEIKEGRAGVFSFENMYFDTVDFNSRDAARIIPFNAKVKKYAYLQFLVQNDKLNEGFGVYGIEKRYTAGNYKKY